MSQSIDERVLSMQFDNRKFEKNLRKTSESLEEFEEQLQFKDAGKGFEKLTAAADQFNVDGVLDTLDQIKGKFSVLEMVVQTFVKRAASDMYNWAKGMAKDLSFGQISAGFSKYEENVRSVNTIATATGKSVDEVNESLQRLMWYTDETSASYSDMVNNIGKFTSQGIDLDESIQAMEGIANLSYLSGQGIAEASRAMYNFSQALGVGSVKLMDWRSIENANMATQEFKQTIIDTAIELGSLRAGGITKNGQKVTYANFSSTLASGWFNKDVLLASLKKYGGYGDMLYEYLNTHDDVDTASAAMERLGAAGDELGFKAFKAAQQARTFADAIGATRDAVSSGWLQTFQYIIGDTEEATELFTDLANALWDVFASGGEARNELLQLWHDNEGRATLLEGIYSALEGIASAMTAIKEAFTGMFPEFTVDHLLGVSNAVKEFGERLKSVYWYTDMIGMKKVETLEFKYNVETNFTDAIKRGETSEQVKEMQQWLTEQGYGDLLGDAGVDGIFGPRTEEAIKKFQEDAGLAITGVYDEATHKSLGEAMFGDEQVTKTEWIHEVVDRIYSPALEPLVKIAEGFGAIGNLARRLGLTLWQGLLGTFKAFEPLVDVILDIGVAISEFFIAVDEGEGSTTFFENLAAVLEVFNGALATGIQWFADLLKALFLGPGSLEDGNEKMKLFAEWVEKIKNLISNSKIGKWFKNLGNSFSNFVTNIKSKGFIATIKEKSVQMWNDAKTYFTSGQFVADAKKVFRDVSFSLIDFISDLMSSDEEDPDARKAKKEKIKARLKKYLQNIIDFFQGISKKIEELVAKIKETPAYKWIEEKVNAVKEWIGNFFANLFGGDDKKQAEEAENQVSILDRIVEIWETVKTAIVNFFTSIFGKKETEDVEKPAEEAEQKISFFERLKEIWNKIVAFFGNDFFTTLGDGFALIGKFIAQIIELAPFLLGIGLVVFIIVKIFSVLGTVSKILEHYRGIITKSPIEQKDKNSFIKMAAAILMIGAAIGIVAYSLGTLAKLELGQVIQGSVVIAIIAGVLIGSIITLQKIKVDGPAFMKTTGALLMLAGAIALIAAAVVMIGGADKTKLIRGGIVIGIILVALFGFIVALNLLNSNNLNLRGLIEVAGAIAILAVIAWIIGNANFVKMRKGIGIISIIMLALGVFIVAVKRFGGGELKLGGLLALAGAIAILAVVVSLLGLLPTRVLRRGIIAVGFIMVLLAAFAIIVSKATKNASIKLSGFVALAGAIAILSLCVSLLGLLPKKALIRGVLAVAALSVIIIAVSLTAKYLSKNQVKTGPLFAIAAVVAILAGIIVLLAMIPANNLGMATMALLAIAAAVVLIGAVLIAAAKFDVGAGKMISGAAGIGAAFAIIIGIVSALFIGLGELSRIGNGRLAQDIVRGGRMLKLIGAALAPLKDTSLGTIVALALTLGAIIGKTNSELAVIGGAMAVMAAFDLIVALIGGLFYGLGALDNIEGHEGQVSADIEAGGEVFSGIADALGGFGTTLSEHIMQQLTNFGAGISALRNGIKDINNDAGAGKGEEEPAVISELKTAFQLAVAVMTFFVGMDQADENGGTVAGKEYEANAFTKATETAEGINTSIDGFGKALSSLRAGIAGLHEYDDIESDLDIATTLATTLDGFFKELTPYEYYQMPDASKFFTAPSQLSNDISVFSHGIGELKMYLGNLSTEYPTLEEDTKVAVEVARIVDSFCTDLKIKADLMTPDSIKDYNNLFDILMGNVEELGRNISRYATLIAGISESTLVDDTDTALDVVTKIQEFAEGVVDSSIEIPTAKAWGWLTKRTKFQTIIDGVGAIADSMSTSHTKITKAGLFAEGSTFEADFTSALGILTQVATFSEQVSQMNITDNVSKIQEFFGVESSPFQTVIQNIGMMDFSPLRDAENKLGFQGIANLPIQSDLDAAIGILRSLALFMAEMTDIFSDSEGNLVDISFVNWSYQMVVSALGELAEEVKKFDGADYDSAYAKISQLATDMKSISDFSQALPEDGIYDFSGMGDLIDSFVTSLETGLNTEDTKSRIANALPKVLVTSMFDMTGFDDFFISLPTDVETAFTVYSVSDSIKKKIPSVPLSGIFDTATLSEAVMDLPSQLSAAFMVYNTATEIANIVGDMVSGANATARGKRSAFYSTGGYLIQGMADGMTNNKGKLNSAIRRIVQEMISTMNNEAGVQSPSKVTYQTGMYVMEGLTNGLKDYSDSAVSQATKTASRVLAAVSSTLAEDDDLSPTITPVLDLSEVSSEASKIGRIFGSSYGVNTSTRIANSTFGKGGYAEKATNTTTGVISSITGVRDEVSTLKEAMKNLKVVMKNGALVGAIGPDMDRYLGHRAAVEKRRG